MEQRGISVVDASIAMLVTPIRDEPLHLRQHALQLYADIRAGLVEAHIPDRWEDEIGAAIWEAVTRGRLHLLYARPLTPDDGWTIFSELLAFADIFMHWHHRDWSPEEVWAMAAVKGCSYYDAIYLVLAQRLDATFWTADRRLYEFLRRRRQLNRPRIGWIGDYGSS